MPAHSIAPWIKFSSDTWFEPGKYRGCRRRVEAPRVHVGHWTASKSWNRTPKNVFNALKTRKDANGKPSPLSIHFTMDAFGNVWQMADCEKTVCYHAGAVNEFAIGTEIISPGLWRVGMDPNVFTKINDIKVHGRMINQVAYLPAQLEAYVRLCDTLHEKLGIKLQVPADSYGNILSDVMLPAQRQKFEGNIEHLHCASKKLDGGLQLSKVLVDTGRYILHTP